MVGHNRANVCRDEVAMGDGSQREAKTPAARAAVAASLQASLRLTTSPYDREASSRERDRKGEVFKSSFGLFLVPPSSQGPTRIPG